jgi:putative phosphoesterase
MRIGVLSDTHGYLDPQVPKLFVDVDHILHAGDIGLPWVVLELRELAPVTAVSGNSDDGLEFRSTELIELAGRKFLLHHIVNPHAPAKAIGGRIVRANPDVVVFGHTHRSFSEVIGGTFYLNPGYAGRPRQGLVRSVAILHCDERGITTDVHRL